MLIVGMYLLIPVASFAATAQVIVITASPLVGNECVKDLVMEFELPDQVLFSWTPAEIGNGTKIVMNVGDWPADCLDGLTVYEGNATSTSQTIDTDDLTIGLYYHVYNIKEDGNCSSCYATGSVIASDSIDTGGVGNVTIDTTGLSDMADMMKLSLVLIFAVVFGMIGVFRASITGYVVGLTALVLATTYIWDSDIGAYLGPPLIIIMFGLMGSAARNALSEGLRVF